MNKKLKIFVCTPSFLPIIGGAELGIHEIYNRIGKKHEVVIITPKPSTKLTDNYAANDHLSANYKVVRFNDLTTHIWPPSLRIFLSIPALAYYFAVKRTLKRLKADVINYHFIAPQGVAIIVNKYTNHIPSAISLVARTDVIGSLNLPLRLYSRICLMGGDIILPISSFCLKGENIKQPVEVIPYGVNTDLFTPQYNRKAIRKKLGIKPNQVMLFTIQRLAPIKRVDILLDALSIITRENHNVVLVIAGKGEEQKRLKDKIIHLGLQENAFMAGYVSEDALPGYFGAADIFVFHSMFETFGIVLAQAMAAGLPIVAANTSCVPEVVIDKVNGLLVEALNVEEFAQSTLRLIKDKNLRLSIAKTNRKRAEVEFNWDNIADKYEEKLLQLANRGE
jgi:glycosyltransferase involved in cell wall biosynthesis